MMMPTRKALLRALATPASTYTSTASTSRSFTSLLQSSKTISQSSALTRPQRSAVLASLYRRTYATTDDAKAAAESAQKTAGDTVNAAKETLASNAGSAGTGAEDTARAAQDSASTITEAMRDSGESMTERVKDGVGAVGDALSGVAARSPRASSAQGTPIREEPTRTPRTEGGSGANLYIGNLYFEVTGQRLQEEFGRFGQVKSAKVINDGRGLSKGFGYVEFNDEQSATAARNALDGQQFEGRQMVVQYAIRAARSSNSAPREAGYVNAPAKTLFIGNLSYEMSDKDLNDLFREIKNVLDVRVAIDRRTGQPRGFAHADFVDVKSAEAAADFLKTREFYGRRLRVDFASQNSSGGSR